MQAGEQAAFAIQLLSKQDQPVQLSAESMLQVAVLEADKSRVQADFVPSGETGLYEVGYIPSIAGTCTVTVTVCIAQ